MYKKTIYLLTTVLAVLVLGSSSLLGQATFQFTLQPWGTFTTYDHPEKIIENYYKLNTETGIIDLIPGDTIAAYESQQLGVGIRRARLRGKMTKGKAAGFVQFDAATAQMMDAQIDYSMSDNMKLRLGRHVGAGSQAGGHTSHTAIDFVERSIVGRMWASGVGRSDYRTYGLSLIGKTGMFDYQILANNGSNTMNLKPYGTKSSGSATDTGLLPQLDFMVSSKLQSGISLGMHYGLPNEDRINISSATGFVYYTPNDYKAGKIRGKFDFAQVKKHDSGYKGQAMGLGLKGFYRLSDNIEVGAGYESWDPDSEMEKDAFGNVVMGVTYSLDPEHWKDSLFKLTATIKTSEQENQPYDPVIVHMLWQVYMH